MGSVLPGWFTDPTDTSRMRWWDGSGWTPQVSQGGRVWVEMPPPASTGARLWRLPIWAWILIGVVLLAPMLVLSPVVAPIALVVLITALVAVGGRRRTWLRLGSRTSAIAVTSVAAVVLLVTGSISAAAFSAAGNQAPMEATRFADTSEPVVGEILATESTPTPTPTPTPEKRDEVVTEVIAFEQSTVEDAAMPRGQTQVTTIGQNGTRTLTYAVTILEGVETGRELVSDVVTVAPIAQVTSIGTYDPPPPPAPAPVAPAAPANSGCDPNYADACVPISSDVDCAGGSGNGPAYFDGVARVVGADIYDLDRDGDGYACETW